MAKDDDYVVFDLLEKRGQCSRMFERPPSLLIDRDANEVGFTKYAQRPLRTRKGQRKDMTIGSKKILKTSPFRAPTSSPKCMIPSWRKGDAEDSEGHAKAYGR
jgi:hypothetical protein